MISQRLPHTGQIEAAQSRHRDVVVGCKSEEGRRRAHVFVERADVVQRVGCAVVGLEGGEVEVEKGGELEI